MYTSIVPYPIWAGIDFDSIPCLNYMKSSSTKSLPPAKPWTFKSFHWWVVVVAKTPVSLVFCFGPKPQPMLGPSWTIHYSQQPNALKLQRKKNKGMEEWTKWPVTMLLLELFMQISKTTGLSGRAATLAGFVLIIWVLVTVPHSYIAKLSFNFNFNLVESWD